jgi:hypothetical protein
LRRAPGGKRPVPFDDVMEALRTLDKQANEGARSSTFLQRLLHRNRSEDRPRPSYRERHSIN